MRLTEQQARALEILVDHRRRYATPNVTLVELAGGLKTSSRGATFTLASLVRRGLVQRVRVANRVGYRITDDHYERLTAR